MVTFFARGYILTGTHKKSEFVATIAREIHAKASRFYVFLSGTSRLIPRDATRRSARKFALYDLYEAFIYAFQCSVTTTGSMVQICVKLRVT